jgi:hypothetical protein
MTNLARWPPDGSARHDHGSLALRWRTNIVAGRLLLFDR